MKKKIRESLRTSKTRASKHEIQEAFAQVLTGNSQEQRLIRQIAAMMNHRQDIMAYISFGSILLGVLVNEICTSGDYKDKALDEFAEAELQEQLLQGRSCVTPLAQMIKMVQSLLTAVLVGLIIVQHKLDLRSKNGNHTQVTRAPHK